MEPKAKCVIAALMAGILCMACTSTSAKGKQARAAYPAVLHGIWEGGVPVCKLPGNPDSDARMEINADKLIDYEEWNEPVRVVQISKNPKAWKIVSKLHLDDGDVFEVEEIFLLSAEDNGRLTVVNSQTSMSYLRCK